MEQVHLKYGTSAVDFEIDGAKSVKYLYENKMRVIEDIKAEFLHCVTDGVIGTKPLKELIAPTDPVTIVISDMTRFWMRQDVICELLVKYLHDEMGVGYDQIAVVVALGTHRKNTAEDRRKLASEFVYDHVASVTDHDCDAPDLVYIGTTSVGHFLRTVQYMPVCFAPCSSVCSRLISPSVSSWHKQDNTSICQSGEHIQHRTPYNS